jgi:molybdopterin-guanine dinucleotide biosynthesis protein A
MGRPKAALPFGKATILERLIDEFGDFAELIIVAAPAEDEPYAIAELLATARSPVILLRDESAFEGPVPAVIQGLRAAVHRLVMICSCDLPLLRAATAQALVAMVGDYDAAVPVLAGQSQPLCAAYRKSAAEQLAEAARAERRLTAIVEHLNVRRITESELSLIDPDLRSFFNVNTPDDYTRALRLAGL